MQGLNPDLTKKNEENTVIKNPAFRVDMPDVDIIRRGDTFYMISTTMYFMPGAPILRSKDLKNWEIVSYVFDRISDGDGHTLRNGQNAYGKAQWATSLTYHNGCYYACFVCHDLGKTFIYHSDDIESSFWERYEFDRVFHDMSFLFWEDRSYLIYGNGEIGIVELTDDLSAVKEGGRDELLFSTPKEGIGLRCEGARALVRNGFLYLFFIEWPTDGNARRREVCYRAGGPEGPFERKVILDDDMGYRNRGIAQGCLIDDEAGNWYGVFFQDHDAVGRIPFVMKVRWENDWPMIGEGGRVPKEFSVPLPEIKTAPLVTGDSLSHMENVIPPQFQWNHNPDPEAWSFTGRPGYLRLGPLGLSKDILDARNTLTVRTVTPYSSFTVEGDFSALPEGGYAGICALIETWGTLGIRKDKEGFSLVLSHYDGTKKELEASKIPGFNPASFFIKIEFNFANESGEGEDLARFFYSADKLHFTEIGSPLKLRFTLKLFTGCRLGIFAYSTNETGGMAEFRNLVFGEEPDGKTDS
ncbi:MAG: glycoside hydrolase 43 family protein [Lachnospiraceae bacterium]|nr:glycoside hydrolase 43 family protein [Lachnospiraceae bacterium]